MSTAFYKAFEILSTQRPQARLEVQPDWHGPTGYMNGAAQQSKHAILPGAIGWAIDQFQRRIIVIGTPLGNIVVFERNPPIQTGHVTIVVNYPTVEVEHMVGGGGALSEERIEHLLGQEWQHYGDNFGYHLAQFWARAQSARTLEDDAPPQNTALDSKELGKPITSVPGR